MTMKIAQGQNGSYTAEVVVNVQMPDDYGERLYARELEMLVDYLAGLK